MEKYQFKTNIKCDACIAKVTPHLNSVDGIERWEVNTLSPEKILTVHASHLETNKIKDAVNKAGFKAEQV